MAKLEGKKLEEMFSESPTKVLFVENGGYYLILLFYFILFYFILKSLFTLMIEKKKMIIVLHVEFINHNLKEFFQIMDT